MSGRRVPEWGVRTYLSGVCPNLPPAAADHAPSRRRIAARVAQRASSLLAVGVCLSISGAAAGAQVPTRPDSARRDTTAIARDTAAQRAPRRPRGVAARPVVRPPISPRRALIYSLLAPGLGQARLDRTTTGAFFVVVEAGALAMVAKSAFDLAEAKAFRGDSTLAPSFPVDTAGKPIPATGAPIRNQFTAALVRSRRVHLEDWLAVIAFNHLIAGAEAYVSANLWDVPGEVAVRTTRRGPALAFRASW